jgi:L-amino acid N-acyltransferase YncA
MGDRVDAIVRKGLPYLVAIARSIQPQEPSSYVKEKIVGFAYLDDYHDKSSMYRFTFELELYVHIGYQSQNIGSCLLDKLLEMCNTGYNACGGYEYRNEYDYLKNGPRRIIKTMILKVHKEHGEKDDKTAEFLRHFKFQRSGHISRIGYKHGKEVDVFLYSHTTTETIDSGSRPMAPLDH